MNTHDRMLAEDRARFAASGMAPPSQFNTVSLSPETLRLLRQDMHRAVFRGVVYGIVFLGVILFILRLAATWGQ